MKKRSLLAATAMLLVALLVATGTTYAWFTSKSTASTSISMDVAKGTSLEIRKQGTENWSSYLDTSSLGLSNLQWLDMSTATGKGFFTKETSTDANGVQTITGYKEGAPVSVTIEFRSTENIPVTVTGALSFATESANTSHANILNNARVTVTSGSITKHFATSAGTIVNTIKETAAVADEQDGTYDTTIITADTETVQLTKDGNYYKGSATFSFWIEGTKTDNSDITDLASALNATFTFKQVP